MDVYIHVIISSNAKFTLNSFIYDTSGRPGSARDWTHNLLLPLLHPPSPPNHTFKSHLFSIGRKKEDKKSPFWPPPLKKTHT